MPAAPVTLAAPVRLAVEVAGAPARPTARPAATATKVAAEAVEVQLQGQEELSVAVAAMASPSALPCQRLDGSLRVQRYR